MRILVAEDEKKMASFIHRGLKEEGFIVDVVHDGDAAYRMAQNDTYNAMVLDIMLPGRDGLSILKNLREKNVCLPVILLTARSELNEKIEGLRLGADDYLTKPFYIEELVARVQTVIRRAHGETTNILRVEDLSINLVTREVMRNDSRIYLSPREFALLVYLARSPGRVLTRTQICEHVWEYHFDPMTNVVGVYIQRLRKKIDDGFDAKLIETVRGVGYRIGKAM